MSVFTSYFRSLLSQFPTWNIVLGMVLMAALTAWEMLGVTDGRYLTITHWIKSWMPISIRIMILAWLCWHFVGSDLWGAKQ
jgi:hypothetical protein